MDVHCTSCNEPWDIYHLRHDAVYETDLSPAEAKAWIGLSPKQKLTQAFRAKFSAAGYDFGASVINVLRCPACRIDSRPDADKAAMKAGIEEILGDDLDGIAAAFQDHGL